MKRFLLSFFFCFLAACSTGDSANDYSLTIVHTNDLHARLEPFQGRDMQCRQSDAPDCLGGFARIAGFINKQRQKTPDLILLDAGDRFSGTLFYTLHKSRDISMLMNQMNYTAMALGNHEFDDGLKELELFGMSISSPLLAANVKFSPSSSLSSRVKPSMVIQQGGRKIGIIGLVLEETPLSSSGGKEAEFLPVIPSLRNEVEKLKKEGTDFIIVLTHTGLETDKRIAEGIEGIDVIVGGHSHSLLSNGDIPGKDGAYPEVVYAPDGKGVLITTAGKGGRYVGVLTLRLNERSEIVSYEGDAFPMNSSIPEEGEIKRQVAVYAAEIKDTEQKIISTASGTVDLNPADQCTELCPVGEFLTDILYRSFAPVDAVFINSGSIRHSFPKGDITFGDLVKTYPFENEAVLVELTGDQITDMLEVGVSKYEKGKRVNPFLQSAGIRYTFNAENPPGRRLVSVEVKQDGQYVPLVRDKGYQILLSDFIADGGDGYPRRVQAVRTGRKIRDVLEAYLIESEKISPVFEKRIQEKK